MTHNNSDILVFSGVVTSAPRAPGCLPEIRQVSNDSTYGNTAARGVFPNAVPSGQSERVPDHLHNSTSNDVQNKRQEDDAPLTDPLDDADGGDTREVAPVNGTGQPELPDNVEVTNGKQLNDNETAPVRNSRESGDNYGPTTSAAATAEPEQPRLACPYQAFEVQLGCFRQSGGCAGLNRLK